MVDFLVRFLFLLGIHPLSSCSKYLRLGVGQSSAQFLLNFRSVNRIIAWLISSFSIFPRQMDVNGISALLENTYLWYYWIINMLKQYKNRIKWNELWRLKEQQCNYYNMLRCSVSKQRLESGGPNLCTHCIFHDCPKIMAHIFSSETCDKP